MPIPSIMRGLHKRLSTACPPRAPDPDFRLYGYTSNYTDAELEAIAKNGKVNDRFVVIVMEKTHAENAAGHLGPKMPSGEVRYWATTFDQMENGDTDPRRLMELTGRTYDPSKNYSVVIADTQGADAAGAHTIVPTHEKLGDFAAGELDDLDLDRIREVMTSDYGEKYAEAMKEFKLSKRNYSA